LNGTSSAYDGDVVSSDPSGSDRSAGQKDRRVSPVLIAGAIIGLGLLAFVLQNRRRVPVHWLFFNVHAPLYVVTFVTIAAAVVAAELIAVAVRRHRRSS
jgi:uncharacterized integral membrane protein